MKHYYVKIGLENGHEVKNFEILIPQVYKIMPPREEIFCMVIYQGKWNVCTKFCKNPCWWVTNRKKIGCIAMQCNQ